MAELRGIFTRNRLKLFAMVTMLCDHVGVILVRGELYLPLRIVGRVAFPIFAYFLVQGFLHTSNYSKYLLRIGIFALLSEIPFDIAFQGKLLEFELQNVMFTLFIALVMLYLLQRWEYHSMARVLILLGGGFCGWLLRVDYGWFGVVVIGLFYLLRSVPKPYQFSMYALLFFSYGGIEGFGVLGILCVLHYREEGEDIRLPKYLFYVFYPAHLLVLWAVGNL